MVHWQGTFILICYFLSPICETRLIFTLVCPMDCVNLELIKKIQCFNFFSALLQKKSVDHFTYVVVFSSHWASKMQHIGYDDVISELTVPKCIPSSWLKNMLLRKFRLRAASVCTHKMHSVYRHFCWVQGKRELAEFPVK